MYTHSPTVKQNAWCFCGGKLPLQEPYSEALSVQLRPRRNVLSLQKETHCSGAASAMYERNLLVWLMVDLRYVLIILRFKSSFTAGDTDAHCQGRPSPKAMMHFSRVLDILPYFRIFFAILGNLSEFYFSGKT